jgi:predicted dehydrogenase
MAGTERVFDPAQVRTTTNPADIAANPDIDIVSICTPTDTHADLANLRGAAVKIDFGRE